MIKFYNSVPDAETTILRKVGYDVLDQLYKLTNLPAAHDVIINGMSDSTPIKNDNILDNEKDRPYAIKSSNRNLVKVSIDEEMEPGTSQTIPMYKAEEESIFQDPDLGIVIYPAYQTSRLTITLQMHFSSRKRAMMWVNEMNGKIASGSEHTIHLLTYSYYIPEQTIVFLKHAYELRERLAGYNETFEQWMERCGNKRITTLVNHAGKNGRYAIGETQSNSYGKFEFSEVPKGDISDNSGFELNVEYIVIFKRPFNVIVNTPTVIHQTLLDERYVNFGKRLAYNPMTIFASAGTFAKIIEDEFFGQLPPAVYEQGIRVPWFDVWKPYNNLPTLLPLITALCRFTSTDEKYICTLPNITNRYQIQEDIFHYIAEAGEDALRFGQCAVKFSLFCNDEVLVDTAMELNGLVLSLRNSPNLRRTYRVAMGLNRCLWSMNDEQLELLCKHGKACIIILRLLFPRLSRLGKMPILLPDGSVAKPVVKECISLIEKQAKKLPLNQNNPVQHLVTCYTLIADRKLPNASKDIYNGYVR